MTAFNPREHLIPLKGRNGRVDEYLPVAARLAWFRAEHPDGTIALAAHTIGPDLAVFHARVALPDGGKAEGWGSETPADFRDYIEKASTKALGRALAALGYGTLQAGDDLDEGGAVVDAPQPAGPAGMPLAAFADYLLLLWRMAAEDVPGKVIVGHLKEHDDQLSDEQATIVKEHWRRLNDDRKARARTVRTETSITVAPDGDTGARDAG